MTIQWCTGWALVAAAVSITSAASPQQSEKPAEIAEQKLSPPYGPSPAIDRLKWDEEVVKVGERTGDNWPLTWVAGDLQITAWGDGPGFDGLPPRLSLGFAQVFGVPPNVRAEDFASDADTLQGGGSSAIKASGLLMADGMLYLWVRNYKPPGSDDFTNAPFCLKKATLEARTSPSIETAPREAPDVRFSRVEVDPKPPGNPWVKMVGDFNNDGKLDIAIGGQKGPLVWYANPGWRKQQIAQSGWQTVGGAAADMDGDGDTDVVPGAQVWFENPLPNGDPATDRWPVHRISDVRSHEVSVVDLDRDGHLDVVARDQSGFGHHSGNQIHFWRWRGADDWQHHAIDCPHGEGLAVADLDRDGDADVVIGACWFANPGRIEGDWAKHVYSTNWTWADTKVAVGDLNGDGRLDIVLSPAEYKGQNYRLAWYEAPVDPRRSGWKETVVVPTVETVMHALQIADMNGDGRMDIITARMHQGAPPQEVCVFLNENAGRNWTKHVVATTGSHDIIVADMDGDGRPDIVGANHGGPHQPVELWRNLSSGTPPSN